MSNKEVGKLISAVQRAGWRVEVGKHIKCFSPDGRFIVVVSRTPSSRNALDAMRADFRRCGLDLDAWETRR